MKAKYMFYSYHNLQGYYSNSFQFLNFYHCIKHLHSTMVLFKLEASYGGIVCKKFTFHYGPIQIKKIYDYARSNVIYIPLWSYSNFIHCPIGNN